MIAEGTLLENPLKYDHWQSSQPVVESPFRALFVASSMEDYRV